MAGSVHSPEPGRDGDPKGPGYFVQRGLGRDRPSPTTSKAFCAAVRRLRPILKDGQRKIDGEVKDVFLGLSLSSLTPSTTGQESAHSVHSGRFPQISLQDQIEEGERVESIKIENELNGLNGLSDPAAVDENEIIDLDTP